jgi:serine/arginine repetitive matrix protein 2
MLGRGAPTTERDRTPSDFSDVVRRVGGDSKSASARRGFEIYVDPAEPATEGEVVLIKKKKSRPVLNGLRWGSSSSTSGVALDEVTNVPSSRKSEDKKKDQPALLKVKDENASMGKWWSIGRSRKESKEKENKDSKKEKRAKCMLLFLPEPLS